MAQKLQKGNRNFQMSDCIQGNVNGSFFIYFLAAFYFNIQDINSEEENWGTKLTKLKKKMNE